MRMRIKVKGGEKEKKYIKKDKRLKKKGSRKLNVKQLELKFCGSEKLKAVKI